MSVLVDNPYAAELSASRHRLKRLKDNYARRSAQKRGREEQGAEQQAIPGPEAALAEEEQKSSRAAQQLVARCLLDPAVTIPLDSANLHKKARHHGQRS